MITLVNEELFDMKVEVKEGKNRVKEYMSSYASKGSYIRGVKASENDDKVVNKKITFPVIDVTSPDEDYTQYNLTLKSVKGKNGKTRVSVIANDTVKYDNNLLLIAFPYDGILKPLPEKMPFRVIKGFVAQSDFSTIRFKGKKYRKVLYLVVMPNMAILAPDHPYHKDELYFNIDTYLSVKQPDGSAPVKSSLHRLTVSITAKGVTSRIIDKTVDFLDMKQFVGTPAWNVYEPPKKERPVTERKPYVKKPYQKSSDTKSSYPKKTTTDKKPAYNKLAATASSAKPTTEHKTSNTPPIYKPGKVKTLADVEAEGQKKIKKTLPLVSDTAENDIVVSSGSAGTSLEELLKNANLQSSNKGDRKPSKKRK